MTDGYGGLVVCQDKGRSMYSEHCKQLKNLLMLTSAIVYLLTMVTDYSLSQVIAISGH